MSEAATRALRIALVAGEASGDLLGAALVRDLKALHPEAEFAGIAGPEMRAAGVVAWHDCEELAVMGLVEVLKHLPRLLRLRKALRERLLAWQPDVLIGIDAPDFNLGLEAWLKKRGIRTVHYVSPSVWAWRESRAATIGRSADRVLCLFPMEPAIYAKHGVDARFVGHPLAAMLPLRPEREAARSALGIAGDGPLLALLPGSRGSEIARLGPVFLDAVALLLHDQPGLRVLAPMANARCRERFQRLLLEHPASLALHAAVHLVDGRAREAMVASDAVLLASGTAALEAMLAKRPMVVAYRIAPLTHFIVKAFGLLKVDRYSLPNVLAGEALVIERMQADCRAEQLAEDIGSLLREGLTPAQLARFEALHESLRAPAPRAAALAVAEGLQR
ncbi:lipid-A-disaccharide synthase [Silanimonas sp.]|uniref:lipid-A-disaccharide synthase n=1 Tax=Silanimonas sp. TaxID=1929290 RepID=UPI001BBD6488|nr:lipid-A-disaccharide synthase [Silanimonas sp.]MBS3896897.1 lipid-A-disaccharide synthase [Silanimonas sp.]MBS3924772.1 lipid-A-disaccharide synthase [Xanthomonadaceae bacterium]